MDTELDGKVAQEVMGLTLVAGRVWQDGNGQAVYVNAEPTEEERVYGWHWWNPTGNWAHFGLVLKRVYELFQRDAVGPNDTLELTWWQHGDCFFRMDECFQAGPPANTTADNMVDNMVDNIQPLQAMCSAILAACCGH